MSKKYKKLLTNIFITVYFEYQNIRKPKHKG